VIHALIFIAAATPSGETCAAYRTRAAGLGPVKQVSSTDGGVILAAKRSWRSGHLTYTYTQTSIQSPPTCGEGVVTYDGPRFSFWRDATSTAALSAVYGKAVAADFAAAKLEGSTKSFDQSGNIRQTWFRGKTYGYTILAGTQNLTVLPLKEFDAELDRALQAKNTIE
jgi:hypothetical protein